MPFESGKTFKLTNATDKSFEVISKAVFERISHWRPDNERMEIFFMNGYGSAVRRLKILACKKTRNNGMKRPNWISTIKALYEHCISTEISELNLFVDRNIGTVWCKGKLPEVGLPYWCGPLKFLTQKFTVLFKNQFVYLCSNLLGITFKRHHFCMHCVPFIWMSRNVVRCVTSKKLTIFRLTGGTIRHRFDSSGKKKTNWMRFCWPYYCIMLVTSWKK